MSNRAKTAWRLTARILWGLVCANLVSLVLEITLGIPNPGGWTYVQSLVAVIVVLVLPALTISLMLRIVASRDQKQAPHEAPLDVYERPLEA